ncbi:hypothetical protein [Paracraurococcus ruber]|uniref:Core-binding (CB) domain-containing protein n=1 Tax=Paracraurococcus ruber TaxID=77675 RepID=A0ABS1D1Z1_9PROT|nr:hypothetical protein [Paracraurococcus ruber]MBK1660851.1 hypothetical protein [Paracraurococcus ruber]
MSGDLVPAPAVAERPTPKGKRALRDALGYIACAAAAETRRAYAGDWRHFGGWCQQTGLAPLPATPATIAAYLAAHADIHALATLRRRLAAIARAHREARHAFDSRDPAIRNALRGIAREHTRPARQAAALTTAELRTAAWSTPAGPTSPGCATAPCCSAMPGRWRCCCRASKATRRARDSASPSAVARRASPAQCAPSRTGCGQRRSAVNAA